MDGGGWGIKFNIDALRPIGKQAKNSALSPYSHKNSRARMGMSTILGSYYMCMFTFFLGPRVDVTANLDKTKLFS